MKQNSRMIELKYLSNDDNYFNKSLRPARIVPALQPENSQSFQFELLQSADLNTVYPVWLLFGTKFQVRSDIPRNRSRPLHQTKI